MNTSSRKLKIRLGLFCAGLLIAMNLACSRTTSSEGVSYWSVSGLSSPTDNLISVQSTAPVWGIPVKRETGEPIITPTPDAPHSLPKIRTDEDEYIVQFGDNLGDIANRFGVSVDQILAQNELVNPNVLEIGQLLRIPAPQLGEEGLGFKILPNSELVNGPINILFNIEDFLKTQPGFLNSYKEELDEESLSGAQIIDRVANEYSVNPRLLLAVLEYQSSWLSSVSPKKETLEYPIGFKAPLYKGLYRQLSWAANNLNRGYYLWRVNGVSTWILADNSIVPVDATINAGTAGIQQMFAFLYNRLDWEKAVGEDGLFAVYKDLFGYPFDFAIDPLVPDDLQQPKLQLPFASGEVWSFTGGPHGAWGDGSGWGALDFAPPGDAVGCVVSDDWALAVTDGLVTRSGYGAVIQDLDGDGFEQTGWVILYMHIETRDRVPVGTSLKAGDRIGHPSCEGGQSSGTHVHIARKYNGEWIPADQEIPFVLDGWVSRGAGKAYDGFLERDGVVLEAYAGNSPDNEVYR